MANLDTVRGHIRSYQQQRERGPSGVHGETLEGVCQWADRLWTTVEEQHAKVRDDAHLTPEGKRQRVTELAKKADLSFLVSKRTAAETDAARLRVLLRTVPKSDREPMLAFLYEDARRRKYEDKPQHVIQQVYLDAVNKGDHELVRAFTDESLGILDDKGFGQQALIEHAEKAHPAVFANYEQATNLVEHLSSLEGHMRSALQALAEPDTYVNR